MFNPQKSVLGTNSDGGEYSFISALAALMWIKLTGEDKSEGDLIAMWPSVSTIDDGKAALDGLFDDGVDGGLENRFNTSFVSQMKAMYPAVGESAGTHKLDLSKVATTNDLIYNGVPLFTSDGIDYSPGTVWGDTQLQPDTDFPSQVFAGMTNHGTDDGDTSAQALWGINEGSSERAMLRWWENLNQYRSEFYAPTGDGNITESSITNPLGTVTVIRTSSTAYELRLNKTQLANTTGTSGAIPNTHTITVGGAEQGASIFRPHEHWARFYMFWAPESGDDFNGMEDDWLAFYDAIGLTYGTP